MVSYSFRSVSLSLCISVCLYVYHLLTLIWPWPFEPEMTSPGGHGVSQTIQLLWPDLDLESPGWLHRGHWCFINSAVPCFSATYNLLYMYFQLPESNGKPGPSKNTGEVVFIEAGSWDVLNSKDLKMCQKKCDWKHM